MNFEGNKYSVCNKGNNNTFQQIVSIGNLNSSFPSLFLYLNVFHDLLFLLPVSVLNIPFHHLCCSLSFRHHHSLPEYAVASNLPFSCIHVVHSICLLLCCQKCQSLTIPLSMGVPSMPLCWPQFLSLAKKLSSVRVE